ncbi:hypothetical protein EDD85DRAFT_795819 [Armillaria nabsnona]|nr:hypothetical protein EDD85DRAFT_795819 [Armillaria nabsnona]
MTNCNPCNEILLFPGFSDDIIFVTFPTGAHRFMEASLWKAITANENLAHAIHMRANIDFPSIGKVTSKNPDLCIYALDPTRTLKNDVWPLFVMEIVYAESCRKPMRDILEALLSIEHEGDMRGALCLKVFRNPTSRQVTRLVYTIIFFLAYGQEDIAENKNEKHRHMLAFKLYAKPPHAKGQGKWVPTDGEHFDKGMTFRMYL